jgi:hypothetical protein
MKNEIRIRDLRKYEVTYGISINQQDQIIEETFTADDHECIPGRSMFYRLGNVIKEIHAPLINMTISPVDAEDLTDIQE